MKVPTYCMFCKTPGSGSHRGYHYARLLLGVRLHSRTLKKGWVCRVCLGKHDKLDDHDFLEKFDKAKPRKS